MSEPRSDYGFPLTDQISPQTVEMVVRYMLGDPSIIRLPRDSTRLERAQAIAAEVRARKFPPVVRLTPMEKL